MRELHGVQFLALVANCLPAVDAPAISRIFDLADIANGDFNLSHGLHAAAFLPTKISFGLSGVGVGVGAIPGGILLAFMPMISMDIARSANSSVVICDTSGFTFVLLVPFVGGVRCH
jgi:hypothetical protein